MPRWIHFLPLSKVAVGDLTVSDWCDIVTILRNNLRGILSISAEEFWKLVKTDAAFHLCIATFLQNSPRPHDLVDVSDLLQELEAPSDAEENFYSLYNIVFLACLRMSTKKEMKNPEEFGKIIYDTFAFDIPKIFDLCALYGASNRSLLSKMVSNIFGEQPKYTEDLEAAITSLGQAFDRVITQVQNATEDQASLCEDLISYFIDSAITLQLFVDIYPPAAELLYNMEFMERIASFYDAVVSGLDKLAAMQENSSNLRKNFRRGRVSFLKLFRDLLTANVTRHILENQDDSKVHELLEFLQSVLTHRAFVADYERCFPVWDDLHMLQQTGANVDDFTLQYITEGYREATEEYASKSKNEIPKPGLPSQPLPEPVAGPSTSSAASPDEMQLIRLISQVQDMLPELGDGFIEACLNYYGNNPEQVVNALLEDNLPPHLAALDRSAKRGEAVLPTESGINGFEDGISGRMEDLRLDKKGRKGDRGIKRTDLKEFIEDKKSKAEIKELISKYATIDTEGSVYDNMGPITMDEYDDEYDDTYDSYTVGKLEPDASDTEPQGSAYNRSFVTPRVLQPRGRREEEEDYDKEEEGPGPSQKPDHFVENPEDVRQRMEERRQSQMRGRGRGRGHGGPPRERDVVGKAKGQGQDKEVLLNRRHKMMHKGSHKHLSDKKRGF